MMAEHKPTDDADRSDGPDSPAEAERSPADAEAGDVQSPNEQSSDQEAAGSGRIELEPLDEDRFNKINHGDPLEHPPHIRDLDVCPNCGAPMAGETTVVCLRCGFNLRTLKPTETAAEMPTDEDEAEPEEPVAPVTKLRVSISWVIAGLAAALLIAGLLAGAAALFPDVAPVAAGEGADTRAVIPWSARWVGALKFIATTIVWFGCAIAALGLFARLVERPIGTAAAASAHVLAAVTAMQLARYWDLPVRSLEWTAETATAVLVFLGLSLALLHITRRDVITYALITALTFLCLFFGSRVITWAMA